MVNRCSVPGCRSVHGKPHSSENPQLKMTLQMFPKDEETRKKWILAVGRRNWEPSKYSKICILHFHPSDFKTLSEDSNASRRKTNVLTRRILKKNAVPSIFSNYRSFSPNEFLHPQVKEEPQVKSEEAEDPPEVKSEPTEDDPPEVKPINQSLGRYSSELQNYVETIINTHDSFECVESVSCVEELHEKLNKGHALYPQNVKCELDEAKRELIFYSTCYTHEQGLHITFSLIVLSDMSVRIWMKNKRYPFQILRSIMDTNCIGSCSMLLRVLSYLHSIKDKESNYLNEYMVEHEINESARSLKRLIPHIQDESKVRKLSFLLEQLDLLMKIPGQRQYSESLSAMSLRWKKLSKSLYLELGRETLSLPNNRLLFRISSKLKTQSI